MAKQLDKKQMIVLTEVSKIGGWKVGCGWAFGTNMRTDNILNSLVPRRLVERVGTENGFGVFKLTPEGEAAAGAAR